jgi:hypothetical protein
MAYNYTKIIFGFQLNHCWAEIKNLGDWLISKALVTCEISGSHGSEYEV